MVKGLDKKPQNLIENMTNAGSMALVGF